MNKQFFHLKIFLFFLTFSELTYLTHLTKILCTMTTFDAYLNVLNLILTKTEEHQNSDDRNHQIEVLNELHRIFIEINEDDFFVEQQIFANSEQELVENLQFFAICQLEEIEYLPLIN